MPKYQNTGFVYFDPPYFNKAGRLYQNSFTVAQHTLLRDVILKDVRAPWIVSYDNAEEIRRIYAGVESVPLKVTYSAARKEQGSERMFFCEELSDAYLKKTRVEEI